MNKNYFIYVIIMALVTYLIRMIPMALIRDKIQNKFIKSFLDSYKDKTFIKDDGSIDTLTNVAIVSEMVKKLGVKLDGTFQKVDGMATFYPQEYFSPYDYINCYSKETENTYAIHHYYKSWLPYSTKIKTNICCLKIIMGLYMRKSLIR